MGWQKSFTLSRRGKGCYLITEEVLGYIQPGLRDVKANDYPNTVILLDTDAVGNRSECCTSSCKTR
jgi:hypothetical protein